MLSSLILSVMLSATPVDNLNVENAATNRIRITPTATNRIRIKA